MSFASVKESVALLVKFLNLTDGESPKAQIDFPPKTAAHAASSWFMEKLSVSNSLESACESVSPVLYSGFLSISERYVLEAFAKFSELEPSLLKKCLIIKHQNFAPTLPSHSSAVFEFYKQMTSQVVSWQVCKPKTLKKVLQSPEFCKSLLALCIEVYFLLLDLETIGIGAIIRTLKIDALDVWKQLDSFTNCFNDFPGFLLKHLKEVEKKILIELVWESTSPVLEIIKKQMSISFKSQNVPFFKTFCTRLNKVVSFRVEKISEYFALEARTRAKLWRCTKYYMAKNLHSVVSLDFVVLSSLYSILRIFMQLSLEDLALIYSEVFFGVTHSPICSKKLKHFFKNTYLPLMDAYLREIIKIQDSIILPLDPMKCFAIKKQMFSNSVGFSIRRMQSLWNSEGSGKQGFRGLSFNFSCY